ncbi:MAG: NERD domain-containing protein [Gammaproteobacteria bacterium]|nr:NERD domain-containing protein [Gammaproteobacteria bacterium]
MMETLATKLIPTALFVAAALLVFAILRLTNYIHRRYGGDPFPTDGLIREPAYTKRRRQRALEVDIFWHAVAVPTLLLAWNYSFMRGLSGGQIVDFSGYVLIAAAGGATLAYFIQHLVRLISEKRHLVLQTSAEVATGQSINQLMRRGYWVFHDVVLGKQQIQHLIIGSTGVFVVASKAHRVPRKLVRSKTDRAEANFDGEQLTYPDWVDTDPIQAVLRQSQMLGKWLSGKIGEAVTPQPVLALPGWYVQSSDWKRVIVCDPSNPTLIIKASRQTRLDSTAIRGILENLKKQTRDSALQIPAPQVPQ